MSGPIWIGKTLFLGRTAVGRVEPEKERGLWLGASYLPGAAIIIGRNITSEAEAKDKVLKSANSRCKALFGAGMETTTSAVSEGRTLRVAARAIWRAGAWRCDRPVNAQAMFSDLGRALGFKPEDAPRANDRPDQGSNSSAEARPDDCEFVEPAERMPA
jgi:hypothetical protein